MNRRRLAVTGAVTVLVVAVGASVALHLTAVAAPSVGAARPATPAGPADEAPPGAGDPSAGSVTTVADGFAEALSSAAAHAPTTTTTARAAKPAGKAAGPALAATTTQSFRGGGASFTVAVTPTGAPGGGVPTLAAALQPSWALRAAHVTIGSAGLDAAVPVYACNQTTPDPIRLTLPAQTFAAGRTDMVVTFTLVACTVGNNADGPPTIATVHLPVIVP